MSAPVSIACKEMPLPLLSVDVISYENLWF